MGKLYMSKMDDKEGKTVLRVREIASAKRQR